MKLLALQNLQQNLQSSLHFMSMGMAAPQLAAMTSLQRLAGIQSSLTTNDQSVKEEPSVKRTQLWLQQVNKYRHKPPKEELDANHEQLWEQQISRVKRNPVRSPLEPVEIVIEDDGEKS